jgi:hypothetical protein
MRVLATVVLRTSKPQEAHGYLIAIDWGTRRVLRTIAAPGLYSELGYRNRGGRRGFRGLARHRGQVWLAASDAIYILDPETLGIDGVVSHRYMGSIHDLFADGDGVWVTCTGADGIFKINREQEVLDERWVKGRPERDLRIHFDDTLDTLHVNSIYRHGGDLYFYAAFTGEVFRVTASGVEVTHTIEPMCHNVFQDEGGFFRAVSPVSELRYGETTVVLPREGPSREFTHPGWLRGLEWLPNGHVLVGSSPARIFEVDLKAGRLVDQLVLKEDSNWTISGITVLPGEGVATAPAGAAASEASTGGLTNGPEGLDPHAELSRLLYAKFKAGAYADALDLSRVCLQFPDRYSDDALDAVRFHQGLCHFFLGDYEASLAILEQLETQAVGRVRLGPLKYYEGLCHERMGDRRRALECFRQAPRHELDDSLQDEVERSVRRLELTTAD